MNIWGKGGIYAGQYERHSVEKDVNFFIGWQTLDELFKTIESPIYKDVGIVAFKLAARITEALNTDSNMFVVDEPGGFILVRNFPILKRWTAIDKVVICGRCQTENNKFDIECVNCKANLVHAGKRKFKTQSKVVYRKPFFIKIDEPFSKELIEIIHTHQGLLFSSPYTHRAYTRQWAYNIIKDYGKIVGLDNLYNHWFRSQRLMQLGNQEDFTKDELKAFSGIMKDETLDHYVKRIQSYTKKLGLNISSEKFTELMEK